MNVIVARSLLCGLALVAGAVAACSSDSTNSSNSSSSSGGANDAGVDSSSVSDSSTPLGDGSTSEDGRKCNALVQEGAAVKANASAAEAPPPSGGAIANGKYILTSLVLFKSASVPFPLSSSITVEVSGTSIDSVTTDDKGAVSFSTSTMSLDGLNATLTTTCSSPPCRRRRFRQCVHLYGHCQRAEVLRFVGRHPHRARVYQEVGSRRTTTSFGRSFGARTTAQRTLVPCARSSCVDLVEAPGRRGATRAQAVVL
jgi:hypothetical protein